MMGRSRRAKRSPERSARRWWSSIDPGPDPTTVAGCHRVRRDSTPPPRWRRSPIRAAPPAAPRGSCSRIGTWSRIWPNSLRCGRTGRRRGVRGAADVPHLRHERHHEPGPGQRFDDRHAPSFRRGGYLATIERHRVTRMHLAPPMILQLVSSAEVDRFDHSSVRWAVSGAAPLDAELAARFESASACRSRRAMA